jgi:nucleotide-binding universal stress UspA family protein
MPDEKQPYVILAAVSFDETGESALSEAVRIAQLHPSSQLHVVHVLADSLVGDTVDGEPLSLNQRLGGAPEELQRRVQSTWLTRPLKVTAHIRAGTPAGAVLQTAGDIDADLIVVGTHKRSGVEKLLLGSVAERVLREAHCPVLVAAPKDYLRASQTSSIEPPCPDCVQARRASAGHTYWCERHSRSRLRPHVYEPSDARPHGVVS